MPVSWPYTGVPTLHDQTLHTRPCTTSPDVLTCCAHIAVCTDHGMHVEHCVHVVR